MENTIVKATIDKVYCMSHYLAFRFIKDENINFFDGLKHTVFEPQKSDEIAYVKTIADMDRVIREKIEKFYEPNKTAILLSGGMDSAILASYCPEGTKAYTFKCVAEGAVDETERAKKYADKYKLDHEIVEMRWEDFEELTPEILKYDGVPFHSIEVQLVKVGKLAKSQGIEKFICGRGADVIFGGLDKLLHKDWDFDEFCEWYNFTEPQKVLKMYTDVKDVYEKYRLPNNKIDFITFMNEICSMESTCSYWHAFTKERLEYLIPYSYMQMAEPLDLNRIRNGESKYMVRELFAERYPGIPIPDKIPMPRATEQWLKDYKVSRPEFKPNCEIGLSGDQKWQLYCLETFLNMHDKGEL